MNSSLPSYSSAIDLTFGVGDFVFYVSDVPKIWPGRVDKACFADQEDVDVVRARKKESDDLPKIGDELLVVRFDSGACEICTRQELFPDFNSACDRFKFLQAQKLLDLAA